MYYCIIMYYYYKFCVKYIIYIICYCLLLELILCYNWYNSLKIFININNLIRYICNNTWTKVKGPYLSLWYAVISLYMILRCPRKSLRIYILFNVDRNICTQIIKMHFYTKKSLPFSIQVFFSCYCFEWELCIGMIV